MTRSSLDDAQWASLMLVIQRVPRASKRDEVALRRFVEAALWVCRTGAPWRDLPAAFGHWASVYHRWRRWCVRGWWEVVFEALRPPVPAGGLLLIDGTTCEAHRSAAGAARSTAAVEALGRSRGGTCSKLHACVDGAGRVLRSIAGPGHHSDLHHAPAMGSLGGLDEFVALAGPEVPHVAKRLAGRRAPLRRHHRFQRRYGPKRRPLRFCWTGADRPL